MFYFCHLKNPSNIMKNVFNSIFIFLKNNFFVNKYKKKNVLHKTNKSLFWRH